MKDKNNRIAIITGASSGIGEALARAMHGEGFGLCLAARSMGKLERLAKELDPSGSGSILCVATDVSKEQDCKELVDQCVSHFGRIDCLVNNAGISMRALLQDATISVIDQLMKVNFYGALYCTKFALDEIVKSRGTIIGISSIAGFRGLPGRTGYSASKFAMQGFLEALRTELINKGVHVMIVCPGYTQSNIRQVALNASGEKQGESPRDENSMMSAEEVAGHILTGMRKRKKYLILTSQGKLTVFLNKLFPGLIDKLVYRELSKEEDSPFT